MFRQRLVITDANGRTVTIQIIMPREFMQFLRTRRGDEYWNARAVWQAQTFGGLGANSGEVTAIGGGGENGYSHVFHLQLGATLGGGHTRSLLLIKMWITPDSVLREGSGTLFHGVNLGLQSGEITWSQIN